jgi:hypothetical protein
VAWSGVTQRGAVQHSAAVKNILDYPLDNNNTSIAAATAQLPQYSHDIASAAA